MDITQIKEVIGWIIGLFSTSVVALIIGIISIIRSGKMLPRDLKGADLTNKEKEKVIDGADLDNRAKELDLIERYDGLIADLTIKYDTLKKEYENIKNENETLRDDYIILKDEQLILREKINSQDIVINHQTSIIEEQKEEITMLMCELNNYKEYTKALIEQMKEAQMIPVEMKTLPLEDCTKKKRRGKEQK